MAFEVTTIDDCADEETFLRFALVPCASGPSGATAPIITFHRAQPDADRPVGDYVGLCVTPAYLEHVVSSCAGPPIFHGGSPSGVLDPYAHDEWIKLLLKDVGCECSRIRGVMLPSEPAPLERLDVYRVTDGAGLLVIDIGPNAGPDPFPKLKPQPKARPRGGADWLYDSDDEAHKRKRRAAQHDDVIPLPSTVVQADDVILEMLGLTMDDVAGELAGAEMDGANGSDVGDVDTDDDADDLEYLVEPDDAAVFPDLATVSMRNICEWGVGLTVDQILHGLLMYEFRVESSTWTVWMGTQLLGRICPQQGVIRGECAHPRLDVAPPPIILKSGKEKKQASNVCKCRISLALRSDTLAELRLREADIVRWFVAGSLMNTQEHLDLAADLQRKFHRG